MPTAEATKTMFRSKDQTLRLVKERTTLRLTAQGEQVPKPDVTIEFRNGTYVPQDDPQFSADPAKVSDVVSWLENHRLFNVDFFEVGKEPDRPTVEASDVIAGIISATNSNDPERIRELVRLEYATYSRPLVIDAGRSALRLLNEDPDKDTKPAQPTSVTPAQVEEVAQILKARLEESGDVTKPLQAASAPNPAVPEGAPAAPAQEPAPAAGPAVQTGATGTGTA